MMNSFGWDHMDRFTWFGTTLMFVVSLIALLALIYIVIRLLSSSGASEPTAGYSDRAVEILRERFARGEMNEEEYGQARETLDRADQNPVAKSR